MAQAKRHLRLRYPRKWIHSETSTVADFKLPVWRQWTQGREERSKIGSWEGMSLPRASTPGGAFSSFSDTFRWVYPRIFRTRERFLLFPPCPFVWYLCRRTRQRWIINEEMIYRFDVDKFHSKLLVEVRLVSRFWWTQVGLLLCQFQKACDYIRWICINLYGV